MRAAGTRMHAHGLAHTHIHTHTPTHTHTHTHIHSTHKSHKHLTFKPVPKQLLHALVALEQPAFPLHTAQVWQEGPQLQHLYVQGVQAAGVVQSVPSLH